MAADFRNAFAQIVRDGDDFVGHLSNSFYTLVNGWEDALAKMAVTGKANFKGLYQGIGESLLKGGMQKGVSGLLGHFGLGGLGDKPDGTQGNPMWVRIAGAIHGLLGGAPADDATDGDPTNTTASVSPASMVNSVGGFLKGATSLFSNLGSLFGGFLASGGDVRPGKAYIVGEKHPEFFVPKASGAVVPSLSSQQLRPMIVNQSWNIQTPDADSFRRSHSQIIRDGIRIAMLTNKRNG
jgi:phage-related minor tail protein